MNFQVEKLENSMAAITVEIPAEDLEKAMQNVYLRNRKAFNIPGFRKGKVPRPMIERMYGKNVFAQDAAYDIIDAEYPNAMEQCDESISSDPELEMVQLEAGSPFIFKATVALKPEMKLGVYKGVKVARQDISVTEEEIDEAVDRERNANARTIVVEGRPVKDGDEITLDYSGSVDGVAFEGGTAENQKLVIGSGSFIPGFEDQIIGMNAGDEGDINVTFPEKYHADELAGKAAVFHVNIKEIKEKQLPDADDDFASEVSEFDTMAEYRDSIRKEITERKEQMARTAKEDAVLEEVVKDAALDIPEAMLKTQQRMMLREFQQNLAYQGLDIQNYFKFTGTDEEAILEELKPQAEKRIRTRLALEAVVAAENIVPTQEDIDKEIARVAESYGMEVDKYKEAMGDSERTLEQFKNNTACTMALNFLVDNSVETEPEEKKEEE